MQKYVAITAALIVLFACGVTVGWWANSPGMDLLCSKESVYVLGKDIEGEGIYIKAGRQVNLRICEYAHRFSVELYSEKGNSSERFIPFNSSPNIRMHGADQYSVTFKEK